MPPKKEKVRGARLNSASGAPKTSTSVGAGPEVEETEGSEDDIDSDDESTDGTEKTVSEESNPERGKAKSKRYWCSGGTKACGVEILDREESVWCGICQKWFHPKCQGLTNDAFRALTKFKKVFLWVCMTCEPNLMSVARMGMVIENALRVLKRISCSQWKPARSRKEVSWKRVLRVG